MTSNKTPRADRRRAIGRLARATTLAVAAVAALAATGTVSAQAGWPSQPVKLMVGFPGGSTPDIAARAVADALAKAWGQPVVVENRPGAAGNVAADLVAKATDDHTLGIVINGNLTTAKILNPRLSFDPARDFSFVTLVATAPLVLVTGNDQPTGRTWVGAARIAGDKWSYGSVGIGSVGHLGMEVLKAAIDAPGAVHVPYNGNPAVLNAMLGGQIQAALVPPGLALPQAKAGRLKVVGVTGPKSALAPDVPPLADAGVTMQPLEVWTALVGPASLSAPAKARLAADIATIYRDAEFRQRLLTGGWEPQGGGAAAMATRVQAEARLLGDIIAARGIKLE